MSELASLEHLPLAWQAAENLRLAPWDDENEFPRLVPGRKLQKTRFQRKGVWYILQYPCASASVLLITAILRLEIV